MQDKAEFYAPFYTTRLRYMAVDREPSTFLDGFGGARIGYRGAPFSFLEELRAEIKAEVFTFHFFDYPLLRDRTGFVGELGLGASF